MPLVLTTSIKDLVTKRIDKMFSRESMSLIACVIAFLEQSLPAEWLAAVAAVLITGLSIEKTARSIWVVKLAIANAKIAGADKAEIVDTQDQVSAAP